MSIRKEQALFLIVVALGVWYWSSLGVSELPNRVRHKNATPPEFEAVVAVLAPGNPDAQPVVPGPDREPSESSPLPPRELPRPALATLPVVLPPLDPGPMPGQYHLLRAELEPIAPAHEFAVADASEASSEAVAQIGPVREAPTPDELEFADGNTLKVRIYNPNKVEISEMGAIVEAIRYDWVSPKDGSVVQADRVAEPGEVRRLVLADTRENWALREEWRLRGAGPAQLPARKDFVLELLELAPAYPEFFAKAEAQAQRIVAESVGVDGYRWLQRVIRAQGDLEREWRLYTGDDVPTEIAGTSFLYRGKGEVESRLGLWKDAEADLRRAVEVSPSNPRSNAALARFLLTRGRAEEAEPYAAASAEARAVVSEADDNYEVGSVYVEVLLALGKLDEAQRSVRALSAQNGQAASLDYLRGCVDYARLDFAAARGQFGQAVGEPRAELGLGLCALAEKRWDEAKSKLDGVVRSAPLLRGRAHAALGLLHFITGHPDDAILHLEASRLATPRNPYTLYLDGHCRRLAGDLEGAIQSHRDALAQRDDLVESLAEISLALRAQSAARADALADGGGEGDPAAALSRAARYADRAVQLDASRGRLNLLTELQGQVKFALRDMAGAREAFSRALERGSDIALIGLATIDYEQNRTVDARDAFVALANDTTRPPDIQTFARNVVDLIDDHADKQLVRDGFDRDDLGQIWTKQRSDRAAPTVVDGRLVIEGNMKATPAYVRRTLERAGGFLKVATTLRVNPTPGFTFAGIRLAASGRGSANRFSMRLGINSLTQGLQPYLSLEDGRAREGETPNQALEVPGFDPTGDNRIEVEVVDGSKPTTFRLVVRWNGVEVFARDELRTLRPNSGFAFEIDLMAEARGAIDVSFDDFLLHRRKPQ